MRNMRSKTESGKEAAPRAVERRSFIRKAGAVVTGTFASAVAMGAGDTARAEATTGHAHQLARLSHELGLREDADAIRCLHRTFGTALNERRYEDLVQLFADDARVHFDGEIFAGKEHGIRHLYVEQFGRRAADSEPEPVHARFVDSAHEASIDVAADRKSATARFPCLTQVQCAIEGHSPLVEMARQQGQGMRQWWEYGVYENSYVKRDGEWQLLELRYSAGGRANGARPLYSADAATPSPPGVP